MANDLINQLIGLLQGLKSDASNLHKDINEQDPREETSGDLSQIFKRIGELKSLMSQLNESEIAQLKDELKQLMSGKENIYEYQRDVNNILAEVKKRTEQHEPTKQKIIENLPPEQQQGNVGSLFDNWRSVLKTFQELIGQSTEKMGSK